LSYVCLQFIRRVTLYRGVSEDDVIEDIDEPKNRLFLHATLHKLIENGKAAFIKVKSCIYFVLHDRLALSFMKTPAFGLTVNNIPPSPVLVRAHPDAGCLALQHLDDTTPMDDAYFPTQQGCTTVGRLDELAA
jgi:hypothetical protein